MPFRNLKGALVLGACPAVLISGSAYAGQIRGLMTANLPEVGAAQAAGSAGPAFAAIWAEAAVSITFNAQMCQTSHPSSVGYISRAAANCSNRRGERDAGDSERGLGTAECQLSSPLARPASGQAVRRLQLPPAGPCVTPEGDCLCQVGITQGQTKAGDAPVTLACLPPRRLYLPGADGCGAGAPCTPRKSTSRDAN